MPGSLTRGWSLRRELVGQFQKVAAACSPTGTPQREPVSDEALATQVVFHRITRLTKGTLKLARHPPIVNKTPKPHPPEAVLD